MNKNKLKNILVGFFAGLLLLPVGVSAVSPSDFNLFEGDTIRAENDWDVFVVNENGFKRLFVNPAIFLLYGHLGFDNVKEVSPATRDAFITSGLFRNCEMNDEEVYGLEVVGEDVANLHWIDMSGAEVVAEDVDFFKKVFCINNAEMEMYGTGSSYTSLSEVPDYARGEITPPSANLVATYASDNPASTTLTNNAKGFKILSVDVSQAVDSVKLRRVGFNSHDDFGNVFLYIDGKRVDDPETFNNSDTVLTFNNLPTGSNLSVVVDFNGVEVGKIAQVELFNDDFALKSGTFTFASVESGTLELSKHGSIDPIVANQQNVEVAKFRASASADEDVLLQTLSFRNYGDVDLSNVRLEVDDVIHYGTVSGDYIYFYNLNILVKEDRTETFSVLADVDGDGGDRVQLGIDNDCVIYAVGQDYGYGVEIKFDDAKFDENDYVNLEKNGNLDISHDDLLPQILVWGDEDKTILEFTLEPEDEAFDLTKVVVGGLNEDVVKRARLYAGSTLLDSQDVDGTEVVFELDKHFANDLDLSVMVDLQDQDEAVSALFTPELVRVEATGVGSNEDVSVDGYTGEDIYVVPAYLTIERSDDLGISEDLFDGFETEVLRFSMKAVDGDVRLVSGSWLTFDMYQRGLRLITPATLGSLEVAGVPEVPAVYEAVCPEGYTVNPTPIDRGHACHAWIKKIGNVNAHYVYTAKVRVEVTPAIPAVAPILAVLATDAVYATADYTIELNGDVVAEGTIENGDTTLSLELLEDVEITKGGSEEFVLTVDFDNFGDEGSRFSVELKDDGSLVWQAKDSEDKWATITSVADTIDSLPMKSARFAN